MPVLYCHSCQQQFSVPSNTGECPACGGGFVEEVPAQAGANGHAHVHAHAQAPGHGHAFTRSFTLPGGGRGTVIVSSSGPGDAMGLPPFPGFPGMPAGGPAGGGMGGGMGDPFVQSVLEALTGGGFMPMPGGAGGAGGQPFVGIPGFNLDLGALGAGGAHPGEQEWLDRLMTQIMQEYQPPSQAASQRAVRSLPALVVRRKDAQGEPGEGEAVARAGEPCSVCHDEFTEGEEVLELPCQHNYHKACLLPWLETHNTCPVCRHELPAEDASVEARRRQRAEAAAMAGTGGGSGGTRQGRHGASPAAGGSRRSSGGSGTRLSDLLSNISARWDSLRGSSSNGSGSMAQQAGQAQQQAPPPGGAGSSSSDAAAGPHGARAAHGGTSAAAADAATASISARPSAPYTSGGSSSASGLRQRREAAAAAAERRLHGDSSAGLQATGVYAAPPAAPVPVRPPNASVPPSPAPSPAPSMRQQHPLEEEEEEEEQGSSDASVAIGAVAGGVLGALLGGAFILLGGRRRDRD